jgi:GntR family transcriptional regulator/MocR family aminotransferase
LGRIHQTNPVARNLAAVELQVSLVGRTDLAGEIYRQLRRAILDGRLRSGDRLPPTRELARNLNVSRTTVTVAYDRLAGEGFVTSRIGAGTYVRHRKTQRAGRPRRAPGALRPRPVWDTIPLPVAFDASAQFDFRVGTPDTQLFPYQTWRRLMSQELHGPAAETAGYGDPAGHQGLREAIARHIGVSRGVQASADDVVVTNGTQQAIDVIGRALLNLGDRVAVEDPGYPPPRRLFQSLGSRVAGVPVDSEGLVVEAIPARTRLVYVTPSHQFPLGMPMSLERRLALLDWAERNDAGIIEDDYDSEFRFGGRPIEPLQTIDRSGRVIYVGSFSKTMLPALRLGFVVPPLSLRRALHGAKYVTDWHSAMPGQASLARFILQGAFAWHIRKMRMVYQARHARIGVLLAEHFAEHLDVVPSVAGLHLAAIARMASAEAIDTVVRRASALGVKVQPLSMFDVDSASRPGIVFGYGAIPTARIDEGMGLLRRCLDD